ncbi:hypothetical protein pb186bvf_020522 [Paramecium bursaria]
MKTLKTTFNNNLTEYKSRCKNIATTKNLLIHEYKLEIILEFFIIREQNKDRIDLSIIYKQLQQNPQKIPYNTIFSHRVQQAHDYTFSLKVFLLSNIIFITNYLQYRIHFIFQIKINILMQLLLKIKEYNKDKLNYFQYIYKQEQYLDGYIIIYLYY